MRVVPTEGTKLPFWLTPIERRLEQALDAGRLAHAIAIHGPGGWGEKWLAEALARRIIEHTGADAAPAWDLAHPDLKWVPPDETSGQVRVDEIRALGEFAVRTARSGVRKVGVIAEAEALNAAAGNALLKTLEEPPAGTYLLLVTNQISRLSATVRSRCQLVAVRPAQPDAVRDWLSARAGGVDERRLDALVFELGGAPYAVLDALEKETETLDALLAGIPGSTTPLRSVSDALAKGDVGTLLARWMRYVQHEIARRARGASGEPLGRFLARCPQAALERFWDELAWGRRLVLGTSNANRSLLLEGLLLQWRELSHDSPD